MDMGRAQVSKELSQSSAKAAGRPMRWFWLSLILAAFLPFVMRLGLDVDSVNRQALNHIYRQWKASESFEELKSRTDQLRFLRTEDGGVFEELFSAKLKNDFILSNSPEVPVVKSYFSKEKILVGRIEWMAQGLEGGARVMAGEARFVNNGLLFGFWFSLLLIFLGMNVGKASLFACFLLLLWQVRWNPLAIAGHLYDEVALVVSEVSVAITNRTLLGPETMSLSFLMLLLLFQLSKKLFFKTDYKTRLRSLMRSQYLSLAFEPLGLWLASRYFQWGEDVFWWKVYLGSLCFRFISIPFFTSLWASLAGKAAPKAWSKGPKLDVPVTAIGNHASALLLPLIFLFSGGWEWLNAVLIVDAGWSILMLKAFLTGLLLGGVTGSRTASLFLGLMVLTRVSPPTEGHWMAAAVFGFFLEGLWVGWWMSPMKGIQPFFPVPDAKKLFFVCAAVGWVMGVFIYTAGVPLALCWFAVLMCIWSYIQLNRPDAEEPEFERTIGERFENI